ncbi:MAG: hypothetical protein QXX03_05550 [Nitrososphaerota archaeon]
MLTGLEAPERFIRCCYKMIEANEQPIGVILVAPPGSGKSYLLTSFTGEGYIILSDVSGHGLETLLMEINHKKRGYIILPDMIRAFGRQHSKNSLFAVLNMTLEEGLMSIRRSDIKYEFREPVKFGFIGAITPKEYMSRKKDLDSIGLSSRCFNFSFRYTPEDEESINIYISTNGMPKPEEKIPLEINEIKTITIPENIGQFIKRIGEYLAKMKNEAYDFRSIKLVRKLARGNAALYGRSTLTIEDCIVVYSFLPFMFDSATDLDFKLLLYIGKKTIIDKSDVSYDDIVKRSKKYSENTINKHIYYLLEKGFIEKKRDNFVYSKLWGTL